MTETKMQLEDWLDDLCVRFIINLPREELESVERICFQVEEAQWFYEDFIRPLDPGLPSLSLKAFALRIFQHCPLMSQWSHYHHMTAFSEFLAYKTRVPVRGAILLNEEMDEVVLVKGWKKGANWSFPRGKINKDEKDLDCAIREVYEETGFDVREANLVQDEAAVKHIEITMREQHMRLYVFRGVPRDTHFEPRTRKEISRIEWYKLSELPTLNKKKQGDEGLAVANANKFYMVAPFLHPLKKWIAQQKRTNARNQVGAKVVSQAEGYTSVEENGLANGTIAPELAVPSDLPEVTSAQDASSHLKRLLNIGGSMPAQVPLQFSPPAQPPAGEQSKSNALLELLRKGSQEAAPQAPQTPNEPAAFPNAAHPGVPQGAHAPHLAPNFFPGFPQQQQHLAPSSFMQQTSAQFQNGLPSSTLHPQIGNQRSPLSSAGRPELSASPMHARPMPVPSQHPRSPASIPAPPRHVLAPFQQTGDPQFSQSAQPAQASGAAAPPASKLPPPKLNSHTLALLNSFKDNALNSSKVSQNDTLAAPAQGPQQTRKTSQHQDSLLNLFKGPRATPGSQPVELSGHPVPSVASPEVQILQRPSQPADFPTQAANYDPKPLAKATATISGPMNMPNFEATPKSTVKKAPNGSGRRNNSNRRERELNKAQQPSSPITILPRPQTAKRDGANFEVNSPAAQTSPPAQSYLPQPQAPEPVKPFQPQILRRPEKTSSENLLAGSPHVANGDRKPSLAGLQTNTAELAPQSNLDRRPSQTNAQKEALLSLFGKAPVPPTSGPAAQLDSRANNANQPTTASELVSPLSSFYFPSSGDSLSRHGTPSEVGTNRVASPNNKAFLLGYLQGVAKGSK